MENRVSELFDLLDRFDELVSAYSSLGLLASISGEASASQVGDVLQVMQLPLDGLQTDFRAFLAEVRQQGVSP